VDFSAHYCYDRTCGVELSSQQLHETCICNPEHYSHAFKPCNPKTNTQSLFYFWKPPATCRKGVDLPAPVSDLPCTSCQEGQVLNITSKTCQSCPEGKYSLSGGASFQAPWQELPPQFSTECDSSKTSKYSTYYKRSGCQAWQTRGTYIDSGDNRANHNIESALTYQIGLALNGTLSFEYKVDSDKWDFFNFFIDGKIALSSAEMKEPPSKFTMFSTNLTQGHHVLKWVYQKDSYGSKGADKMFIRSVEVTGLRPNDLTCTDCPPGRFSNKPGSRVCDPCPAGSFSETFGTKICTPCHPWEKSFPGSARCIPNLPCTKFDYHEQKGSCINGTQPVGYNWLQPRECTTDTSRQAGQTVIGSSRTTKVTRFIAFYQPFAVVPEVSNVSTHNEYWARRDQFNSSFSNVTVDGFTVEIERVNSADIGWGQNLKLDWAAKASFGIELPPSRNASCSEKPCPIAQEKDDVNSCKYCPLGKSSLDVGGDCDGCKEGEGGVDFVTHFTTWQEGELSPGTNISTGCVGDCGSSGWRFAGEFADSGAGHGPGANSWMLLQYPQKAEVSMTELTVKYVLSCPKDVGEFVLSVGGGSIASYPCTGCDPNTVRTATVLVPPRTDASKGGIIFDFHKKSEGSYRHDCDTVQIHSVAIMGDRDAIGRLGNYTGASKCQMCAAGSFSPKDRSSCLLCPVGTYTDKEGLSGCSNCSSGEFAHKIGSQKCNTCGAGTTVNSDASGCDLTCKPSFAGKDYDLNRFYMDTPPGGFSVQSRFNSSVKYTLSLCTPFDRQDTYCGEMKEDGWTEEDLYPNINDKKKNPFTLPLAAHVCVMYNDTRGMPTFPAEISTSNGGGIAGFSAVSEKVADETLSGVQADYLTGTSVPCYKADGSLAKEALTTSVKLLCDPHAGVGRPVDVTAVTGSPTDGLACATTILWRSTYACPLCTAQDYRSVETVCSAEGKKNTTYFWVDPKMCFGGVTLPDTASSACDAPVKVNEDQTVFNKSTVVALGVVGTLIGLLMVGGIAYLIKKKRSLYEDNMRLRNYAQLGDGPVPDIVPMESRA